jgi:hypothetical protein
MRNLRMMHIGMSGIFTELSIFERSGESMRKNRNLFNELMEGFDALADQRAGKRTLRKHAVKAGPAPKFV